MPGDAIDAVTFNLRRPERLCAALAALAEVAAPTRVDFADVETCDAALRKVRRGLTMLSHEEFSRFTRAVSGEAREALDAAVERSLRVLRAHEEAMLRWRSDALASLEREGDRDSGTWAKAGHEVVQAWTSLCASER
ncbi:MAG: hypothetical protein U0326_09905 [Polyangiales bacterium]